MASDRIRGDKTGIKIIIDSSAIMMLFEFSINLENDLLRLVGKYHIIVPSTVKSEIQFLAENSKGKKQRIAKPALKLLQNYEIMQTGEEKADDAVLNLAEKLNAVVFSNDKALRRRAEQKHLKTIFLRGKNKIDMK